MTILGDDSSDSSSNHASESATDSTQKPRNFAVKRGSPAPQKEKARETKEKGAKWDRDLLAGTKFLENFNPENSRREKNKRYNFPKPKAAKKASNSMYDEQGRIRLTKEDVCDCFEATCPGCHFPCENCHSQKCGLRCRVNRRWAFEMIEHDGKTISMTNPLITTVNYN